MSRIASKSSLRAGPNYGVYSSIPGSPRNGSFFPPSGRGKYTSLKANDTKFNSRYGAALDSDDDYSFGGYRYNERAPLMYNGRNRKPYGGYRQGADKKTSNFHWFTKALSFVGIFIAVCTIASLSIYLVFESSRSLQDVKLTNMTHGVISEELLIIDLEIRALNPNLWGVSISGMDLDLFARSAYVERPAGDDLELPVWPPWEPDPDDELDGQTMLLGRTYAFETAPTVPPYHRLFGHDHGNVTNTVFGTIRLSQPGNVTIGSDDETGTKKWLVFCLLLNPMLINRKRVIQHPFEIIARGVLRYQPPLGGHRSAQVSQTVTIRPREHSRSTDDQD